MLAARTRMTCICSGLHTALCSKAWHRWETCCLRCDVLKSVMRAVSALQSVRACTAVVQQQCTAAQNHAVADSQAAATSAELLGTAAVRLRQRLLPHMLPQRLHCSSTLSCCSDTNGSAAHAHPHGTTGRRGGFGKLRRDREDFEALFARSFGK